MDKPAEIEIHTRNKRLKRSLQGYCFYHIEESFNQNENQQIIQKIKDSNLAIINIIGKNKEDILIGFEKTIIHTQNYSKKLIRCLISNNPKLKFLILQNNETINNDIDILKDRIFQISHLLEIEIYNFNKYYHLSKDLIIMQEFIKSCISGYLIGEGYFKIIEEQKNILSSSYSKDTKKELSNKEWTEDEYIELKTLGMGSESIVVLIYQIETGRLFVIKKNYTYNFEHAKLNEREYNNYLALNYPLIPKFYGRQKESEGLIFQYIHGQSLANTDLDQLTDVDKITIMFELIIIINYLHDQKFVYRDLNPDNIIIDENKTVFLIDFDRMIKLNFTRDFENFARDFENCTKDFGSCFVSPEVNLGKITYKNDIYSLGKMMKHLNLIEKNNQINVLYKNCINIEANQRPSIFELANEYYSINYAKINFSLLENLAIFCFFEGLSYYEGKYIERDVDKAIYYYSLAANQNYPNAQFNLGVIYYEGKYITRDINKAIYYYSLAANQNHPQAQLMLGNIYYEGKYITRDINKAIHYYSLAANQNDTKARNNLGYIYYEGKYIKRDINKAIHYYSLAANQNDTNAQFNLGVIYYEGKYIKRDINKAIYYYSLAANQNYSKARNNLGNIYYEGKYIERDINKSIYYYSLAANQNNPEAQFNLGNFYYEGKYIDRDINKSIHYLTLAANQNHPEAQFMIGNIYYEGKYITRDINKSIHYLALAANQNHPEAQFMIGNIYYEGKYIDRDINKSIHYLTLTSQVISAKSKDKNQNKDDNEDKNSQPQSLTKKMSANDDDYIEANKTDSNNLYNPFGEAKPTEKAAVYANVNENKRNILKKTDVATEASSSSEILFKNNNTKENCVKVPQENFSKYIKQILRLKETIKIANEKFEQVIQNFNFIFVSEINEILNEENVIKNIKRSNFAVINHYKEQDLGSDAQFFIVSFEKTLLIFNQFLSEIFNHLLQINIQLLFLFMPDTKSLFEKCTNIEYKELEYDTIFFEAIHNMNYLVSVPKSFAYKAFCKNIISCISGYLFQKSYLKTKNDRFNRFFKSEKQNQEIRTFSEDEFIELGHIGVGSIFIVGLVYYIENEELLAIKKPNISDHEVNKLMDREVHNYSNLNHPLLPKFYGRTKDNKYLIIEYINGRSLNDIDLSKFSKEDKIAILLALLSIIDYLHRNNFVYRDLKPNNIIIDQNKTAVLIDFDRMVKIDVSHPDEGYTIDFCSDFCAPEINHGVLHFASDIYSFGKIIRYLKIGESSDEHIFINDICNSCIDNNYDNRASIADLFWAYYLFAINQNIPQLIFKLGVIYYEGKYITRDINKAIHYYSLAANQNDTKAQLNLGNIYSEGQYITRDINKAIHYYSLAANQNHPIAQLNLGNIYSEGQYITRDINKAIYYYSLAANQNHPIAQFNLGVIYSEGKYIERDINKAIHYYSLAANQNHPDAQFNLGVIYSEGKYITRDINKAIHYYSLAANQNHPDAQFNLGVIYSEGKYISLDINKAIYFYSLAANQNHPDAQFNLGVIYYEGKYITRNIDKSIYYFTFAADQNILRAQFNLGNIYSEGQYITRDINKAIHYYSLAANQNNPNAQLNLGNIYYEGKYIERDINKAIYYYSLAANQNNPKAQFNLGFIYSEGKYIERDINKVIYYYSLAANQNDTKARNNLGNIYYEGKYITRDINKAIHYYSLAANQNNPNAQNNLGVIYSEGKYITRDINKAIHYYSLAANQYDTNAQFNLGVIYYEGKYIKRDINKAIYYYSLAADQNHPIAQLNLGNIYYKGKYITRDINEAIHYYSLAANQNNPNAQNNLGVIYSEGKYITRDINKAIHYYSLAANQNHPIAQLNLGNIYSEGQYITRDINEAIHYYSLAANQNYPDAQNNLGVIYYEGKYITRNINKAIYYYSLAANQNHPIAQFNLGVIYSEGQYITKDINKAIYYYSLAANQNHPIAQNNLGFIYYEGKYITRDINKAIYYYSLAANQNHPIAQFNLGVIYSEGKYIERDINKAIHYYSLAANQNYSNAQYMLGVFYSRDFNSNKNMIKAIDYFVQSASNSNIDGCFAVGYFYHEGKYVMRDIKKSLKYYKEASSFNSYFAKNNLGIIYRYGYANEISPNIGYSIEYFEEAIHRFGDKISMYNLAHIYIYFLKEKKMLYKSIELLIRSAKQDFLPSIELLCIVLIKLFGFNIEKILDELKKLIGNSSKLPDLVYKIIIHQNLLVKPNYKNYYRLFSILNYMYDFKKSIIFANSIDEQKFFVNTEITIMNINSEFYEGFGIG